MSHCGYLLIALSAIALKDNVAGQSCESKDWPYKCSCWDAKGDWTYWCQCNSAEYPHDCYCKDGEGHHAGACKCNSAAWPHKCGCNDDEGIDVPRCPSTCGLPCGEVRLEDGGFWAYATSSYPTLQYSPPWAQCLCEWIIHSPPGKNLSLDLNQAEFYVGFYFFVSKRDGGEDVPLAVCGDEGGWPASLCDGVVASGSLHIGLYARQYAFSLSVTTTEEPASEPLNFTVLNELPWDGPQMMDCRCPDGDVQISPGLNKSIISPGFQLHHQYQSFCNCFWSIEAPSECKVSVVAEAFSTEKGFDYLAAYDVVGSSHNSSLHDLATCTGESCEPINSTSNRLALVFASDYDVTDKGFSLTVQTTGCTACDVAPQCENSGTCRSEGPDALCTCLPGTTGPRCEICAPGYSGAHCGTLSDTCLAYNYTCQNGGTCIPSDPKPWCKCVVGYSGVYCETVEDRCVVAKDHCLNGGTCFVDNGAPKCRCADGFTGPRCGSKITTTTTATTTTTQPLSTPSSTKQTIKPGPPPTRSSPHTTSLITDSSSAETKTTSPTAGTTAVPLNC